MEVLRFVCLLGLLAAIGCSDESAPLDKQEATTHYSTETADKSEVEDDSGDSIDDRTPMLSRLIDDHETAIKTRNEAVRLASDDVDKFGAAHEAYSRHDFPQQFYDFAIARDDEASLDACRYIISKFYLSKLRYAAIDHVIDHHLNKSGIDQFFMSLVHAYAHDSFADKCLRAGMKASAEKSRAHATYQMALLQLQRRDWCLDSDESRQDYVESLGQDAVDHLLGDSGEDEIAELLERVVAAFPDVAYFDYSISKRAEQSLFTLRNLEVGCRVPAVVGQDSEGRELSLRDQQGKVVVICFWAHWCGICMESLPRETAFVSFMKDRPFVWLGVNGDNDVELLRKAESSGTVNFRSFHDGQEGAIATQWNIWGFPSVFVVDHEGIIRYKSRGHVDLDVVFSVVGGLVEALEGEE